MTRDDLMRELERQGKRRLKAEAERDEAMDEIIKLARAAIRAGLPKMRICDLAGISRPTLDRRLRS